MVKVILAEIRHFECPNEKVEENRLVTKSSILSMESLGWPNTQIQIHKYTNTLLLKREHLSLEEDGEALTCQALHSEFCLHILLHSDGPSTFPTLPPEGSVATPIPVSCFPSFTLHSEERNTMRKVSKLLHLSSLV